MDKQEKKESNDWDFYADTMEKEAKKRENGALNDSPGVFVNTYDDGLNSSKSIFQILMTNSSVKNRNNYFWL